jgi:hypothetical protein
MRATNTPRTVAFVVTLAVVLCAQAAGVTKDKTVLETGKPSNGLKLTLSAATAEVRLDPAHPKDGIQHYSLHDLGLKLIFANLGKKPIKLDAWSLDRKLKLDIIGPDGKNFGAFEIRLASGVRPPRAEEYVTIEPGKSWTAPGSLYQGGWVYTLTNATGRLTIRATYTNAEVAKNPFSADSWVGRVASNEIVLKVLPAAR